VAIDQQQLTFEPIFEEDGCKVSRSPWGPDDEIGRLNWITPESQRGVLERLDGSRVFDLAVEFSLDMPTFQLAGDMKYEIWMTHTPQGAINDGLSGFGSEVHRKSSYCGDSIAMYTHTGTHRSRSSMILDGMRDSALVGGNGQVARKVEGLVTFTGRGSSNLPGRISCRFPALYSPDGG